MGYYVIVGGEFERPLASLGGWADFKRWLYGFELGPFDSIMHLCEYGWTQDIPEFIGQLELLLRQKPPRYTAAMLRDLLKTLRAAPSGSASILLTDGQIKDDVVDDPGDYLWDPGEDEDEDEDEEDVQPSKRVKKTAGKRRAKKAVAKGAAAKKPATKKPTAKKLAAKKLAAKNAPVKNAAKKPVKKAASKRGK